MSVLVTGAAGYVGAHAALRLREAGQHVVGLDDLSTGRERNLEHSDAVVLCDLLDRHALAEVFAEHDIAAVVHCAARALVGESMRNPEAYYAVNVGGTANLLEAMRAYGVPYLVMTSSASVYGAPVSELIDEDALLAPINPYGASKAAAEAMLRAAQAAWDLRWVALRCFNAAGADLLGRTGEDRAGETHLVPRLLARAGSAMGGRGVATPPVAIHGAEHGTPDGTCVRDYVHVWDVADAHVRALEYIADGGASGAFNLGTGVGYSVREVARAVEGVCGVEIPLGVGPARPGDPPRLVADARRATAALGWQPTLSGLVDILETAWSWHRALHGLGGVTGDLRRVGG